MLRGAACQVFPDTAPKPRTSACETKRTMGCASCNSLSNTENQIAGSGLHPVASRGWGTSCQNYKRWLISIISSDISNISVYYKLYHGISVNQIRTCELPMCSCHTMSYSSQWHCISAYFSWTFSYARRAMFRPEAGYPRRWGMELASATILQITSNQ